MRGKEKCKALKEIRRQIAEENDIPYVVSQCTHQGDCKGTCPKCESELRYLERELAIRQGLGKAVAVVGISTSVCAGLTACSPTDMLRESYYEELGGATSLAYPIQEVLEGEATAEVDGLMTEPEVAPGDETGDADDPEENLTSGEAEGSEQTEEDILMGEVLVPEETDGVETGELEGDIALTTAEEQGIEEEQATAESTALPEEMTP